MNLTETQALITYINQIDARIQINMPTAEVWHLALNKYPLEHARYAAMTYYAYTSPDDGAGMPAITPGILRRRTIEHMEHAQARQAAVESTMTNAGHEIRSRMSPVLESIAKPIPD